MTRGSSKSWRVETHVKEGVEEETTLCPVLVKQGDSDSPGRGVALTKHVFLSPVGEEDSVVVAMASK